MKQTADRAVKQAGDLSEELSQMAAQQAMIRSLLEEDWKRMRKGTETGQATGAAGERVDG